MKARAVFEWMETNLKIRDKSGDLIPLHFNAAQLRLAEIVAERWHEGVPVRLVVPKSRQMGISTWVEGLIVALSILSTAANKAFRAALVAHDDVAAVTIFQISREFISNLPVGFDESAFPLRTRNVAEVAWVDGASIRINSIKTGSALGKGGRLNAVHYSEAANYSDKGVDAFAAYEAIQGAVNKDANSLVIIESTALGRDPFFHKIVDDSLNGRNDFTVVFLPWFLDPGYQMPWETFRSWVLGNPANRDPGLKFVDTEEEAVLCSRLRLPIGDKQWTYRYQHELTPNQKTWRRMMLRSEFGGRHENFSRYYPSTVEEAFSATETGLFSTEDVAHYASEAKEPIATGNCHLVGEPSMATGTWHACATGLVRMWEEPLSGEDYLISADVAEGRTKDFSAAYVLRSADLRVVAAIHAQLEWEVFAELLYATGLYYNVATVVVENNAHPAVAQWLHKHAYRRLYYYYDEARLKPGTPNLPGFNMNRTTRKLVIDAVAQAVRTRRLVNPDPGFSREMSAFVLNPNLQRYEAAWGQNDDRIMACAIACHLVRPTGSTGGRGGEGGKIDSPAMAALKRFRSIAKQTARRPVGGRGPLL